MTERDLQRALKEADAAHRRLPPGLDARVRAGLRGRLERAPRRAWRLGVALALAAAVVIVIVWARAPREVGQFLVLRQSPGSQVEPVGAAGLRVKSGEVTLRDAQLGVDVVAESSTVLRHENQGFRVDVGSATFKVQKRVAPQASFRVWVSDGVIEVRGTTFVVRQGSKGGEVRLVEGAISFVTSDGRSIGLTPGEALRWPVPPPPPLPSPPTPPATPGTDLEPETGPSRKEKQVVDQLLQELTALRSRGQYERAARLLKGAQRAGYSAYTRELLSFELGGILTYQLNDRAAACAHWNEHQQSFGPSKHQAAIHQARLRLGCRGVRR